MNRYNSHRFINCYHIIVITISLISASYCHYHAYTSDSSSRSDNIITGLITPESPEFKRQSIIIRSLIAFFFGFARSQLTRPLFLSSKTVQNVYLQFTCWYRHYRWRLISVRLQHIYFVIIIIIIIVIIFFIKKKASARSRLLPRSCYHMLIYVGNSLVSSHIIVCSASLAFVENN